MDYSKSWVNSEFCSLTFGDVRLSETPRGKPRGISLLQASLPPIFVPLFFYIFSNNFFV